MLGEFFHFLILLHSVEPFWGLCLSLANKRENNSLLKYCWKTISQIIKNHLLTWFFFCVRFFSSLTNICFSIESLLDFLLLFLYFLPFHFFFLSAIVCILGIFIRRLSLSNTHSRHFLLCDFIYIVIFFLLCILLYCCCCSMNPLNVLNLVNYFIIIATWCKYSLVLFLLLLFCFVS